MDGTKIIAAVDNLDDSSINMPNPLVDPLLVGSFGDIYDIPAKVDPVNPDDVQKSWLEKNIVLVIVIGVVFFAAIVILAYCLCCKQKNGYANALYDDDKLMKARI